MAGSPKKRRKLHGLALQRKREINGYKKKIADLEEKLVIAETVLAVMANKFGPVEIAESDVEAIDGGFAKISDGDPVFVEFVIVGQEEGIRLVGG